MVLVAAPVTHAADVKIEVLSSKPNQVSGGDALISMSRKQKSDISVLRVRRNGMEVTSAFSEQDGDLVGLVDRLRPRQNEITVTGATHDALCSRAGS